VYTSGVHRRCTQADATNGQLAHNRMVRSVRKQCPQGYLWRQRLHVADPVHAVRCTCVTKPHCCLVLHVCYLRYYDADCLSAHLRTTPSSLTATRSTRSRPFSRPSPPPHRPPPLPRSVRRASSRPAGPHPPGPAPRYACLSLRSIRRLGLLREFLLAA
jgi:hypothetical protein